MTGEWHFTTDAAAFLVAAAAQAGRAPTHDGRHETEPSVDERVRAGRVWWWVVDDGTGRGRPVHLTASAPAYGVTRIGPVLTPVEHRGRGYASAAVAAVARLHRDEGVRVSLFTDRANEVSNRVDRRLGFRPVADMANVVVDLPAGVPGAAGG